MNNLLGFIFNSKGLPDSTVHLGGDSQPYKQQTNATVPTSQTLVPAGYPTAGTGGGHGYNNYTPTGRPATAYPYYATQPEKEADWNINVGKNENMKGEQKTGHVKIGNATNGAGLPLKLPENGRLLLNVGGNTNKGDSQEIGSVEFGNVTG